MRHSDHGEDTDTNLPPDQHFGIFAVFVSGTGFVLCFFWLNELSIALIFSVLTLILILTVLIKDSLLHPINKAWYRFGILLGQIVNPIILGGIYFSLFLPVGLLLKMFKRDELRIKKLKYGSFWKYRSTSDLDDNNFRQQF